MAVSPTALPFAEQIAFFRDKLNLPTRAWTDIYAREHDYAFVVAGANRDALVADFRGAVDKVIAEGATLEDFRKDFDRIVGEHGWSYNGGRNWRSRVIYETNLRSSYMAGRLEQMQEVRADRPYWRYVHSDLVQEPRPEHLAWDGLVLAADDPWWDAHYPQNAWGCQCSVEALNARDVARLGKDGPDQAPPVELETRTIGQRSPDGPRTVRVPKGIDPGFEYTPGRARLEGAIPPERPDPPLPGGPGMPGLPNTRPRDELPTPRALPADRLLDDNLPDADYAAAFLAEFGATLTEPAIFTDAIGERLVVGEGLFLQRKTGKTKANKAGRGPKILVLAEALKAPDEIYVRLEWQAARKKAVVRRRYLARFLLPGQNVPAVAVFELGKDGWSGITTHPPHDTDINDLRVGVRLYRRGD